MHRQFTAGGNNLDFFPVNNDFLHCKIAPSSYVATGGATGKNRGLGGFGGLFGGFFLFCFIHLPQKSFFGFLKRQISFFLGEEKQPVFHICALHSSLFPLYVFSMGKNIT